MDAAFKDLPPNPNIPARERRKRNLVQAQFEFIINASDDAIISKTTDGLIKTWNPGAETIFGFTADEAIGRSIEMIIPADRGDEHDEILTNLLKGQGTTHFETVRRHKDGHVVEISATMAVMRDLDGQIIGFSKIAKDIGERKRFESAQKLLEAQLRESQKMEAIGTLAGGIAHDFNNIIATILGNTELARLETGTNVGAIQCLEEIRKAGERGRSLVGQILAFSRRQPTDRNSLLLTPVINETVALLRATLPSRIAITLHSDADEPAVFADASQIQQIIINLATNAMYAISGDGQITVRFDTATLNQSLLSAHPQLQTLSAQHHGAMARLRVTDTGAGMDGAAQKRIFEPFYTTKPMGEGTGLGLSVVHGIVQTHGGGITVESRPGTGTTFTIYLPIMKSGGAAPAAAVHAAASPLTLKPVKNRRILYLDDDEALSYVVHRLLMRRGYCVSSFTDQLMALAAVRANPADFDVVLTDHNMPGMSGLDVARELKAIRPDLPIILTSGYIDETLQAQAAEAGILGLAYKANGIDALCDTFEQCIQDVAEKPGRSDRMHAPAIDSTTDDARPLASSGRSIQDC